jgi:hypothetical protein
MQQRQWKRNTGQVFCVCTFIIFMGKLRYVDLLLDCFAHRVSRSTVTHWYRVTLLLPSPAFHLMHKQSQIMIILGSFPGDFSLGLGLCTWCILYGTQCAGVHCWQPREQNDRSSTFSTKSHRTQGGKPKPEAKFLQKQYSKLKYKREQVKNHSHTAFNFCEFAKNLFSSF